MRDAIDGNFNIHPNIEQLLMKSESSLCLTLYDHMTSEFTASNPQTTNEGSKTIFLLKLLQSFLEKGFIDRLLVSNGVCFKTHLTPYGGSGYNAIFDKLLNKYFDDQVIDKLLFENPKRLLLWRDVV